MEIQIRSQLWVFGTVFGCKRGRPFFASHLYPTGFVCSDSAIPSMTQIKYAPYPVHLTSSATWCNNSHRTSPVLSFA